jgi:DNA-directed RNA polymerase subunit RPC12/RpoP
MGKEIYARCADCGAELTLTDKQCPKCGSTHKAFKREANVVIAVKAVGQWIKTHNELRINWIVIALVWIITLAWIAVTSFAITSWLAFLLSIPVSLIIFFIGIYAITRIIEITRSG